MLQRIAKSGRPLVLIAARNGCVAPSSMPMALGVSAMATSLMTVSVALAVLVGSLLLVAEICTVGVMDKSAGAV